jgi:hypothetical protein
MFMHGPRFNRKSEFGRLLALVLAGFSLTSMRAWADDWPQWLGPKRDGIWHETGLLERFPAGGPKERWRVSVGTGYAGPAVAGNRVYITDRILAAGAKGLSRN